MIRQRIRRGSILVSFFLFPVVFYYLSPVLIIRASAHGIVNGSLIIFVLLFVSALFLGRGFCGWLCPGAGCQEALFLARDKRVTRGDRVKWFIWVPWLGAIAALAIMAGGYHEVDFFYLTRYGLSVSDSQSFITYLSVLFLLVVLPALVFGRRSLCHHLCWMAPFMILGRRLRNVFQWPALHLKSSPASCKHCQACTRTCPMSLEVEEMVNRGNLENTECILCGACVDICKHNAIKYGWK